MKMLSPIIVLIGFAAISWLVIPQPDEPASIDAEKIVKTVDTTITPQTEAKSQPEAPMKPQPEVPPQPKWHDGDCEQYRPLFEKYDWDVRTMMAVMEAESTNPMTGEPCDAQVVGDTTLTFQQNGRTYGYSKSLLQIRQLPGREHCDTDDPEVIVECGYQIWKGQGYAAWSVTHGGSNAPYLKYLK